MSVYITLKQLKDGDACLDQRKLFKSLFGKEVRLTKRLVLRHAQQFQWIWAAGTFLTESGQCLFREVRTKIDPCSSGTASWAEYKRQSALTFYEIYKAEQKRK